MIKSIFALIFIYCIFNLILLNQFSFIYKGKNFIYTFDPIHQELLDNIENRNEIMKYITENLLLGNKFIDNIFFKNNFTEYGLLLSQMDTIIQKESNIQNIYNSLIFNTNKTMYEHIIEFIENLKSIRSELHRFQLISNNDIVKTINDIKIDMTQLEEYLKELDDMEPLLNSHYNDPEKLGNIMNRMDIIRGYFDILKNRQNDNRFMSSQLEINILALSQINKLMRKNNYLLKKINTDFEKETKNLHFGK